jgi:hypothetical protein
LDAEEEWEEVEFDVSFLFQKIKGDAGVNGFEEVSIDLVFDDEQGYGMRAALVVDDIDEHGFGAAGEEGEEGVEDFH